MDKIKFIGIVLVCVAVAYLSLAAVFGVITTSAFQSANTVNASANAYAYRATTGALRFSPLFLWFVPAGIGAGCIAWKLKFDKRDQQGY